jgi:diguanylate cyclase (GGDEF)-like protein
MDEFARLRAALSAAGDLAYEWDLATDRLDWLGEVRDVLGLGEDHRIASGDQFNDRVSPEDLPGRLQALADHCAAGDRFDCEYRLRSANGDFRWIHDRGRAVLDGDGQPVRVFGVLRVATNRKLSEARLEYRANYDEITGHYNAGRLSEALAQAIAHDERHGGVGACLLLAIDGLPAVTDAFGRRAADAIAAAVGHRLDRSLRLTDQVGRITGDRFGVVLPNGGEAGAMAAAEKILDAVQRSPVVTPEGSIDIVAAIGATTFPIVAPTVEDVMAQAEQALAEARRRPPKRLALYRPAEPQLAHHRRSVAIGEELKAALRGKRAYFIYEPVIGRGRREPAFYECLLRIADPSGSVLPPGTFVEAAERLGMVRLVDRHGLDLAVEPLRRHPQLQLSLNISGRTVGDRAWSRALMALVRATPDIARRLILEITETAALRDLEESARFIAAVRDLGCRVALDDFGAGFTSFRDLKALSLDIVKIDGAFVQNLTRDRDKLVFIRTLLGLAGAFGFLTVAEGVGSGEEAEILWEEGVDLLQGDYVVDTAVIPDWFSKPFSGSGWR